MNIFHGLALIGVLGLAQNVPEASAAERAMTNVIVAARFCNADGFDDCEFAISSTISSNGRAGGGMLLGVFKTVDSAAGERIVLTARKGEVGANRAGAFAEFEGRGYMESDGEVVATDKRATWYVMENGAFAVMIGGHVFTGRSTDLGLTFASEPERASGDTLTHEVGHWLSLGHTFFGRDGEFDLIVAAPELEGYPEIAGNFRETAEGETGHAHGHLDFLKKVGDPATGRPWGSDTSFEGNGSVTFHFADGNQSEVEFFIETDARSRELTFDVPELRIRTVFPYRVLPCPKACKRTLFHAPAAGESR